MPNKKGLAEMNQPDLKMRVNVFSSSWYPRGS
jgi:hypothetical protein